MKDLIQEFINSPEESLKIPMAPIDDIKSCLEDLGFEETNYETNGWEVVFWITFHKKDMEIVFSGSLYYGRFYLQKIG